MKDIRLVKYQNVWVADIEMDDAAHYCFDLGTRISEQTARSINAQTRRQRMLAVRQLMTYPRPVR